MFRTNSAQFKSTNADAVFCEESEEAWNIIICGFYKSESNQFSHLEWQSKGGE